MSQTAEPPVLPEIQEKTIEQVDPGYLVICWDDPVNLMDYVTHVFQQVFGWPRQKAEEHMLQVHHQGKSVLIRESMEKRNITCISSNGTLCMPPWKRLREIAQI